MRINADKSMQCIVREHAMSFTHHAVLIDEASRELVECVALEPMRKLLAMGTSSEEVDKLDITQPTLQTICEYARLNEEDGTSDATSIEAVNETLKVLNDQVQTIEMEVAMMNLRKRALKRRARILEKLADSLKEREAE